MSLQSSEVTIPATHVALGPCAHCGARWVMRRRRGVYPTRCPECVAARKPSRPPGAAAPAPRSKPPKRPEGIDRNAFARAVRDVAGARGALATAEALEQLRDACDRWLMQIGDLSAMGPKARPRAPLNEQELVEGVSEAIPELVTGRCGIWSPPRPGGGKLRDMGQP